VAEVPTARELQRGHQLDEQHPQEAIEPARDRPQRDEHGGPAADSAKPGTSAPSTTAATAAGGYSLPATKPA
jgi:hypothetical protein